MYVIDKELKGKYTDTFICIYIFLNSYIQYIYIYTYAHTYIYVRFVSIVDVDGVQ